MKVTKFKVLLYLKKGSADKRAKAPIMGRNSMAQFSRKLSCTPNLWNPRSGRLEGKSREAVEVNAKIDKLLLNINSAYDNLLKRNVDFTAQSIKELMQGSVGCQVTLMDMMNRLYADMEKRIGIDRVEGSLVHYKQARTTLSKFIESKFKTKDVAFGQLTNQFISDYYEYLITDCGFISNSTRKHLAILKKACRLAYKEGYLWLKYNRHKTKSLAQVKLLPEAIDLIEKYKDKSRDALMPYINRAKTRADGTTAVMLRITIDGKKTVMATGIYCEPDKWDAKKGVITSPAKDANALRDLIKRAETHYQTFVNEQGVASAELLKNSLNGTLPKTQTLIEMSEEKREKLKARCEAINHALTDDCRKNLPIQWKTDIKM